VPETIVQHIHSPAQCNQVDSPGESQGIMVRSQQGRVIQVVVPQLDGPRGLPTKYDAKRKGAHRHAPYGINGRLSIFPASYAKPSTSMRRFQRSEPSSTSTFYRGKEVGSGVGQAVRGFTLYVLPCAVLDCDKGGYNESLDCFSPLLPPAPPLFSRSSSLSIRLSSSTSLSTSPIHLTCHPAPVHDGVAGLG